MKNLQDKLLIAIVGMAGSGKTEAANFFRKENLPVIRFGDVIDDGIKAEGLEWTPDNNVYYRAKVRKEFGMAAVAIKLLPKITTLMEKNNYVICDGLYSWEEFLFLKEKYPQLFLLCIYSRPSVRYQRLSERTERSFKYEDALKRDITEIEETHKAGPIALANYLIKNENTLENFRRKLNDFWQLVLDRKIY